MHRAVPSLTVSGLIIVLLAMQPVAAHPFGSNHGAAARGAASSASPTLITNADGLFVRATTVGAMDVPLSTGTPGTHPGTATVVGHNTRPLQILATFPSFAAISGEFYAVGYTAGCGASGLGPTGCTGVHSNGGVYKRMYTDGMLCNLGCQYGYWQFDAISGGTSNTYQIQRNWSSSHGAFIWRAWFNGSTKQLIQHLMMERGSIAIGVESGTLQGHAHQTLNMTQNNYRNIAYHRHGAPSSSPPGTTLQHPDLGEPGQSTQPRLQDGSQHHEYRSRLGHYQPGGERAMLTRASTACLVIITILSVGCSEPMAEVGGPRVEASDDVFADLQEPRAPRPAYAVPADELAPISETFVLDRSCDEIAEWLGAPLPYLPTLPTGTEEAICAVENPHGPELPARDQSHLPAEHRYSYVVHVLYVPRLANLPDLSYTQLIEQGAVDISMQFNVPIATLPSEGNPNEVAGGFTVESVRGNRAIVQRLADRQSWVMWFEETEAGPGRHVVVGPRSPEQVFELAQALRRGRPPHERDAAG